MSPLSSSDNRLHLAVAGPANPYAVLRPEHLPLLHTLRQGATAGEAAAALGVALADLHATLTSLERYGLLELRGGLWSPTFVVLAADEVQSCDAQAQELGRQLARAVQRLEPQVAEAFEQLGRGPDAHLYDEGFLLVADRVLDVGLLDALAQDGRLMPPAPPRPNPAQPDARYYLWLIAGGPELLGQYGQRTTPLPWPGWDVVTFGRYTPQRAAQEMALVRAAEQDPAAGPQALAATVGLPCYAHVAASAWDSAARRVAAKAQAVYLANEPQLRALWQGTAAGQRRPDDFGEFFCWYHHIAYAHAIDALGAAGMFAIPPSGFTTALWQTSQPSGAF